MSNTTIRRLTNKIRALQDKANKALDEARELKDTIRDAFGLGEHDGCTVYEVQETRVRSHVRRAYRAVRVGGAK